MTFDVVDLVIKVSTFVLSIAAMVVAWFGGRHKDIETRFRAHGDRVDQLDRRTQKVEQVVEALPSRTELHALDLAMAKMTGELARMNEIIAGQREILIRVEGVVTRHEEHLLEGKR